MHGFSFGYHSSTCIEKLNISAVNYVNMYLIFTMSIDLMLKLAHVNDIPVLYSNNDPLLLAASISFLVVQLLTHGTFSRRVVCISTVMYCTEQPLCVAAW